MPINNKKNKTMGLKCVKNVLGRIGPKFSEDVLGIIGNGYLKK